MQRDPYDTRCEGGGESQKGSNSAAGLASDSFGRGRSRPETYKNDTSPHFNVRFSPKPLQTIHSSPTSAQLTVLQPEWHLPYLADLLLFGYTSSFTLITWRCPQRLIDPAWLIKRYRPHWNIQHRQNMQANPVNEMFLHFQVFAIGETHQSRWTIRACV